MTAAIAVEKSQNEKTGVVSATYVSQASCPSTCRFRGSGCYAESGNVAYVTRRLNADEENEIEVIARSEAEAIRGLSGKRALRVHVVGDCTSDAAARIVSEAMVEHSTKWSQPAWTYTHAWRDVARESWGSANVQASCETKADEDLARSRGYATARVVEKFDSDSLYTAEDGSKILPCPQQTGKSADCISCGLCLNSAAIEKRLKNEISIGFAAHGATKKRAVKALSK